MAMLCGKYWNIAQSYHLQTMPQAYYSSKGSLKNHLKKLQKWFLHQNGVEFNQKSKSDPNKLDASWKPKICRKDAHTADIGYGTLVPHSAFYLSWK